MKATRPILRYHGGKWKIAPWIISHFPKHEIYVEPYGGGASVLLRKSKSKRGEVYNELNEEITNLFRVVREQGEQLADLLYFTPYSKSEFNLSYQPTNDPLERARRTVIRSFMGFGTCVTAKKKTGFRRFAKKKGASPQIEWQNYPDGLIRIIERLKSVVIETLPAVDCIKAYDSKYSLFYVDPPYPHELRCDTEMYEFEMSEDEHRELAKVLHQVEGMVILSGYACEMYDRELFPTWERVERKTFADGAKERIEVLWLNHNASKARQQKTLF